MAKEMIEKIREAEKKADEALENARDEAKKILDNADEEIKSLEADFQKEMKREEAHSRAVAQNRAELIKKEAMRVADKETEKIRKLSKQNREEAIKVSIEVLFG